MGQTFLSAVALTQHSVGQTFLSVAISRISSGLIEMDGLFRRRRLPHWDVDDGIYFVTTCLAGSIPSQGLVDLYRYRDELESRPKPADQTADQWLTNRHKLLFARFDVLLDTAPTVNYLNNSAAAKIVVDAMYHFAGVRYDLIAYVVMPSHFHRLFHPRAEWVKSICATETKQTPRESIMKSLKGFAARQCNQVLGRSGTFWQDEAYDHVVRDADELLRIVEYIENNPVKAGLVGRPETWAWSSARDRLVSGVAKGSPLVR